MAIEGNSSLSRLRGAEKQPLRMFRHQEDIPPAKTLSRPFFCKRRKNTFGLRGCRAVFRFYWTVRIRHGSRVWTLLGWSRPDRSYLVAALVGGIGLAMVVDFTARPTTPTNYLIRIADLLLLDVMFGPLVEESFFRGCLLLVVACTIGSVVATMVTAIVFATLHPVRTFVQWACFAVTSRTSAVA